jgi:hypothetical protein
MDALPEIPLFVKNPSSSKQLFLMMAAFFSA